MRTPGLCGLLSWSILLACGGNEAATNGAQVGPPASSASAPGADTARDSGGAGDEGAKQSGSPASESSQGTSDGGAPRVHAHDPGRGASDIRAIIVSHRDEARACYDKALASHPGMEGDLVVQWTIDPKGTVTQVSVDQARSQVFDPTVVACIGGVIKKIQFAPSPGGFETKAFYPFNFHPRMVKAAAPSPAP